MSERPIVLRVPWLASPGIGDDVFLCSRDLFCQRMANKSIERNIVAVGHDLCCRLQRFWQTKGKLDCMHFIDRFHDRIVTFQWAFIEQISIGR